MDNACFTKEYGKEIFVLKFTYNQPEEAYPLIEECARQVRQRPEQSVLTLTLVSGVRFNTEIVNRLKDLTKGNAPYVRKAAVVGISGIYKVVMNAINIFSKRHFKLFDSREEAVRYLLSD
jgi:hypothetical protein